MALGFEHEYQSLRQEMLERFDRVHDTLKYGIGGFIAIVGYYHTHTATMDHALALTLLELLILAIGMSSKNIFHSIYVEGTYIACVSERESQAKWHRMSRCFDRYLKDTNRSPLTRRLPFPLGRRWGGDSANVAVILIFMLLIAWFEVCSQAGGLSFLYEKVITLGVLSCLLALIDIAIVYHLLFGITDFLKRTQNNWKSFSEDFGTDRFPDPYTH
jgi:hypothetical protein